MLTLAYIVYAFCFFWLVTGGVTRIVVMIRRSQGARINPVWFTPGFLVAFLVVFGIPTVLAGQYIASHAENLTISHMVFGGALVLGIIVGGFSGYGAE